MMKVTKEYFASKHLNERDARIFLKRFDTNEQKTVHEWYAFIQGKFKVINLPKGIEVSVDAPVQSLTTKKSNPHSSKESKEK